MLPSLIRICLSRRSKKCKAILMLVGFHLWKTVALVPVMDLMFLVACSKLALRICKCSRRRKVPTRGNNSIILVNIIRISKMRADKFKWRSRIWKRWMQRSSPSTNIWLNPCTNLCRHSPRVIPLSSTPSSMRKWSNRRTRIWFRVRRKNKFKKVAPWSNKRRTIFRNKRAQAVKETLALSLSRKRFRPMTYPLMTLRLFSCQSNLLPWRSRTAAEHPPSSPKCPVITLNQQKLLSLLKPNQRPNLTSNTKLNKYNKKKRKRKPSQRFLLMSLIKLIQIVVPIRRSRPKLTKLKK